MTTTGPIVEINLQEDDRQIQNEDDLDQRRGEVDAVQPLRMKDYLKLISAGYSFFCAGVNDGSLGPLIPYVLRSYNISTNLVSVVYGTTFFGWLLTALTNSFLCQYLDLGAMLTIGASLQLLSHALRAWFPPFPLYAVTFFIASLGQAFQDTHANTYVSSVKGAHRWLGFIHAMYMLGCLVGPFVATAVASTTPGSRWSFFYLFPLGLCIINLTTVSVAFRESIRLHRNTIDRDSPSSSVQPSRGKSAIKELQQTLRIPGVWLLSMYFFFFLGTAITAGGWLVEFLVIVRKGDVAKMGYVSAGFNGGSFLGRLLLAEPTHRLGERRMIFCYVVLCLILQLLFWLVPNITAGIVTISLFGFFSGPFFATGVSVGSKMFPKHVQSSALSFVFVLGQIGGSVFPAVTGIIASRASVAVLQPMLVGLIGATGVSWLLVPRPTLHGN